MCRRFSTTFLRVASSFSSINPRRIIECAKANNCRSGKGTSLYSSSLRSSSSHRRSSAGKAQFLSARTSHVASSHIFQGGSGLSTPHFDARSSQQLPSPPDLFQQVDRRVFKIARLHFHVKRNLFGIDQGHIGIARCLVVVGFQRLANRTRFVRGLARFRQGDADQAITRDDFG